jgi:adenylate kinase
MQGFEYIKLSEWVTTKKLYKKWNEEFNVPEFDVDMVCDELEPYMSSKGGIILEFHSCDFFPERWFDLVVLLLCDNTELFDRLQQRGYNEKKIQENIECEIFGVLKEEVETSYKPEIVMELRSDKVEDMENNLSLIVERLKAAMKNKG